MFFMKDLYVNWIWPLLNLILWLVAVLFTWMFGVFSWQVLLVVAIWGAQLCAGEWLDVNGNELTKKDVLWHLLFFALLCLVIIGGILA